MTKTPDVQGVYINLPVADLNKSIAFFTGLGFTFNAQFTDATATCMIVSETVSVMLLTQEKFQSFIDTKMADARKETEVLVCLALPSRAAVDGLVAQAAAAGGAAFRDPKDYGFMYEHAFRDLDGHIWELVAMMGDAA